MSIKHLFAIYTLMATLNLILTLEVLSNILRVDIFQSLNQSCRIYLYNSYEEYRRQKRQHVIFRWHSCRIKFSGLHIEILQNETSTASKMKWKSYFCNCHSQSPSLSHSISLFFVKEKIPLCISFVYMCINVRFYVPFKIGVYRHEMYFCKKKLLSIGNLKSKM